MILSGTTLQSYLSNLGSFYQRYFANQGVYDTLLHGAEELLQEAYYTLMETVYQNDRLNMRLFHRRLWLPIDLDLLNVTAMEQPDQVKPAYRIPLVDTTFAEIPYLSDRIGHPRLLLRSGKDYWVEDGALLVTAETYALLSVDPRVSRTEGVETIPEFLERPNPSRTPQALPIPPTGDEYPYNINAAEQIWPSIGPFIDAGKPAVLSVRLWAPRVEVDEAALERFWGALIDVELDSDELHRLFVDSLLWLFFQGPSQRVFSQCLNMAAGLPLVSEDAVLVGAVLSGTDYVVSVKAWRAAGWEDQTYTFDADYNIDPRLLDSNNFGALILRKGDVLTGFFDYRDNLNDPDWWHNAVIPADLFNAEAYRRAATPEREEFLITDADPDYIGDPQLYIGADEDGTINPAVRIKDTDVEAYAGHPDATEDYNDFYLKGDEGQLSILPAVGPGTPGARILGPHTIVLEVDEPIGAGGLAVASAAPRTIRLKHTAKIVNMALGSETRPSGYDGEVPGDDSKPFRFDVGAAAFGTSEELVGGFLKITGRRVQGVTVPSLLGVEGSYPIVRIASTTEIDVVPSNITEHVDGGGLFDSYPFPFGRTYGAPNNGEIRGHLSGTGTAEVGGSGDPDVGTLVDSGGTAATTGGPAPTQVQIPGADLDDYASTSVNHGYYLEIYADIAGTPAWFTARFLLNAGDPTKLDVTWVGGTSPASTGETGLAWRIKKLGSIIEITSGLFLERNVNDVITLSGSSTWGNDVASTIYDVNTGVTPQELTVETPKFLPESGLDYAHTLQAGKNALFLFPVSETFRFQPEHVGFNVRVSAADKPILAVQDGLTAEIAQEASAAGAPWGVLLNETDLVWEFIPSLANELVERRVRSAVQDPANEFRVIVELYGEPLVFPFPDAVEEWPTDDFPTPDATGQWDKRTLGGYEVEVLSAASIKDESIAGTLAAWGDYLVAAGEDYNAGKTKRYLGLVNQGELTDVYEVLGAHQLPVTAVTPDGVWWVVGPAEDTYSLEPPEWPPPGWANRTHNGVSVDARWEVSTNGRVPGNRFKIGYRLFQNYLKRGVWGYDLTNPNLGTGDTDIFVLQVLEKILEQRSAYTFPMLLPGSVLGS